MTFNLVLVINSTSWFEVELLTNLRQQHSSTSQKNSCLAQIFAGLALNNLYLAPIIAGLALKKPYLAPIIACLVQILIAFLYADDTNDTDLCSYYA